MLFHTIGVWGHLVLGDQTQDSCMCLLLVLSISLTPSDFFCINTKCIFPLCIILTFMALFNTSINTIQHHMGYIF